MNTLQALHNRVSIAKLTAPAPDEGQRQAIFQAATSAADHGRLQPWRFLVVEGEGLEQLGELFVTAALADDPQMSLEAQAATRKKPLRAPMVVVAIAVCVEHPKVPQVEQLISAGSAVQNMLNATYALGLGGFWRTGSMAYHATVRRGLGLGEGEQIVGFLYLGAPVNPPGERKPTDLSRFFQPWPAQ